jgi:hypothetical protein
MPNQTTKRTPISLGPHHPGIWKKRSAAEPTSSTKPAAASTAGISKTGFAPKRKLRARKFVP